MRKNALGDQGIFRNWLMKQKVVIRPLRGLTRGTTRSGRIQGSASCGDSARWSSARTQKYLFMRKKRLGGPRQYQKSRFLVKIFLKQNGRPTPKINFSQRFRL